MPLPRAVRGVLFVGGALVALILLTAVLLPFFIDLQRFRPVIERQIETLTGRKATIGPIALRLFPAPSVAVAPVTIAEGPRYPGREALQIAGVSLRLRPMGLLRGRVEFGSIVIDRPTLTVIRDPQGRWSFDDVLQRLAPARPPAPVGAPPAFGSSGGLSLGIERAAIQGGRILVYDDAVVPGRRSEIQLGPVDASLSGWGLGRDVSAELSIGFKESVLRATARMTGVEESRALKFTIPASRIASGDMTAFFPWLGVARPAGLKLSGTVTVEGESQVSLDRMESVQFHGSLLLDGVSYQDATMTQPIEKLEGKLQVDGGHAAWEGFTVSVGRSELHGRLEVDDFLRPKISFRLESSRLDANQLLKVFSPDATSTASKPAAASKENEPSGDAAGGLLQVSGEGTLAVAALRFQTFDLGDVRVAARLSDAVFSLSGVHARMYDGELDGDCSLDLRRSRPAYRLEASLKNIDVNALATAYDPSLKGLLRGRFAGELKLGAAGLELNSILDTASGSADIAMTDGAITSISFLKQLAALLEIAGGKGIGKEETPFESLSGHFAIGQRRARTSDLTLDSADLNLLGTGSVGLDTSLDLGVKARFSEEASRGMIERTERLRVLADAEKRLVLYLKAQGSLAQPKVTLDSKSQMHQIQDQRKDEVKAKVRDRLLDILGGKPKDQTPQPPPKD